MLSLRNAVVASHIYFPVGMQALEILEELGVNVLRLKEADERIECKTAILFPVPLKCGNQRRHLRILPTELRNLDDIEYHKKAEEFFKEFPLTHKPEILIGLCSLGVHDKSFLPLERYLGFKAALKQLSQDIIPLPQPKSKFPSFCERAARKKDRLIDREPASHNFDVVIGKSGTR